SDSQRRRLQPLEAGVGAALDTNTPVDIQGFEESAYPLFVVAGGVRIVRSCNHDITATHDLELIEAVDPAPGVVRLDRDAPTERCLEHTATFGDLGDPPDALDQIARTATDLDPCRLRIGRPHRKDVPCRFRSDLAGANRGECRAGTTLPAAFDQQAAKDG